jgi:hypothetical protein
MCKFSMPRKPYDRLFNNVNGRHSLEFAAMGLGPFPFWGGRSREQNHGRRTHDEKRKSRELEVQPENLLAFHDNTLCPSTLYEQF